MPLDHPLYEEMLRRKSGGSWFWLIGNRLYYIGLLIFIAASCLLPVFWSRKLESAVLPAAVTAALGACTFFLGGALKTISYRIAGKEGIDTSPYRLARFPGKARREPDDYYKRD